LPHNQHNVKLLIIDAHQRVKHSGTNDTLTALREILDSQRKASCGEDGVRCVKEWMVLLTHQLVLLTYLMIESLTIPHLHTLAWTLLDHSTYVRTDKESSENNH